MPLALIYILIILTSKLDFLHSHHIDVNIIDLHFHHIDVNIIDFHSHHIDININYLHSNCFDVNINHLHSHHIDVNILKDMIITVNMVIVIMNFEACV